MKILITNSPLHYTHGHTFTQQDWQTLVLPTLAGIIGQNHDIRIVDNMSGILRAHRIPEAIQDFNPDLIAFSIISGRDLQNTLRVIEAVHKRWPHRALIAGGQGASFYDKELLRAGIRAVIRGEGEQNLPLLIDAIEQKRKDFSAIPGVSFNNRGIYSRIPDGKRIKSLDDSPMPRWDLMPLRRSKWFRGRFVGSVETSRGCPWTCSFCAITSFWEGSFRRKSPERIVEEMEVLAKQGRTHIYMADDNFGMGERHHIEMFELILKRGLDVRFFAQMRTDTIAKHPEMMKLAARAGQYGALVGFDTYDPATFHHIEKVGSIELNNNCAQVLRANKIMIYGSHIYGLPSQKHPNEFMPTFWHGRRNSDLFRMPHFSLLPGTKMHNELITEEMANDRRVDGDDRIFLRPLQDRRRFARWYTFLNLLHILLPDEWLAMLFHSNRNVRILKWRGYVGIARHWFYKIMRRTPWVTI